MPRLGYGGLGKRIGAYLLDWFIVYVPSYTIAHYSLPEDLAQLTGLVASLIAAVLALLYFTLMESSAWRATLGKVAMGIIVTDKEGSKPSFVKALIRNLIKVFFSIGAVTALFTDRKQAVHDMAAGTLVFND